MNSMIGKSTGIALLMAAALLAALFAMGVFSATGVAGDEHITATATLTDGNTPPTPNDQSDDTLTISVEGLERVAVIADTTLMIEIDEDLGALSGGAGDNNVEVSWGGDQAAVTLPNPSSYTAATGDDGGRYVFTFPIGSSIDAGAATIEISLGDGAKIDTNTSITAIEIGVGNNVNTVAIPEDGLAIADAPTGPSITVRPATVMVNADALATEDDIEVKVSGTYFAAGAGAIAIAADPSTGITFSDDSVDATELAAGTARHFEVTMTVTGTTLNSAVSVGITATRTETFPPRCST